MTQLHILVGADEVDGYPAQLAAKDKRIAKLEALLESKRIDRWHATYNAALTGAHAYSHPNFSAGSPLSFVDGAHAVATEQANLAHGPLEGKP